jgi:uncharacterized membrane protein
MGLLHVLAVWFHTLGFLIVMGYYGVLGRILIPAIVQSVEGRGQAAALITTEKKVLPLLLSVALFVVTGAYLLVIDSRYEGLGNFFSSTWTTLMLVKHVVVVVMIVAGVAVDLLIGRLDQAASDSARRSAIFRVELAAEGATGRGSDGPRRPDRSPYRGGAALVAGPRIESEIPAIPAPPPRRRVARPLEAGAPAARLVVAQSRLAGPWPEAVDWPAHPGRIGLSVRLTAAPPFGSPAARQVEVALMANRSAHPSRSRGRPDAGLSGPAAASEAAGLAPRERRRFDRRMLVVLLAALVVVILVAAQAFQYVFRSTPSGETVWQKITAGISVDGSVPAKTALEAFAYDFKVNIPGVAIPSGPDGADDPTDGTGPMRWVQANWDSLTPAQQAVIDPFLNPSPGSRHYDIGAPVAGSSFQLTSRKRLATAVDQPAPPTDFVNWPVDVTLAPDVPMDLAKAMVDDLIKDVPHIGNALHLPVIDPGFPGAVNIALDISDVQGGDAAMLTKPWEINGHYEPCQITAFKNSWGGAQVQGDGTVPPTLHVWLTHEVVHCYQNEVYGDVATANAIPAWIGEGTAFWVAAADTGIAEPHMPGTWADYFTAETALTARNYDSYPWFILLARKGRDLWTLLPKAWEAAAQGPSRSNAFIAVLEGDNPDIVNVWAESYLRRSDWGDPWLMYGFGLPDKLQVKEHDVQAQPDTGWTGSLPSRANTILNVTSSGGEVVEIATNGLASVHDESGNHAYAFDSKRFCTVDSCVCPSGTLLAGQDMAPDHITLPFVAALTSLEGGSQYAIISIKLDDICKRQATPQPSANYGPCGPNCSSTNGDPHMITVNGFRYDFQAAGEFTVLRSPDGSVDIQARQEPFGTTKAVSINTAIAMKVGSHKVGVYMVGAGLEVHVDGSVADLSSGPIDLGAGGRVSAIQGGYEVDLPDGTTVWALSRGEWGIFAQVKPSAQLTSDGQGLLGSIVRGGLGVPALPDGSRLPAATDKPSRLATVYGQFADAWRITDASSLFDYEQGKTTETYTIKPYPVEGAPSALSDLTAEQQATGRSACAAITDPNLADECAFDVAATGETGFAQTYTDVQFLYDNGIVAASSSPAPTLAPATPAPGVVGGAWKVMAGSSIDTFAFGENDTVYADAQTGDNAFTLMALDPVNQKILAQVSVPLKTDVHYAAGSVWLPGLEADASGSTCTVTRFDGQTLAKQATIPVTCGFFGKPEIASDGTSIWYVDVSKYDLGTQQGAVIRQLDPATNAPSGTSLPLPFINGFRQDSQGAFFYFGTDPNQGYYRLATGATAFDQLGQLGSNVGSPAGAGIWVASKDYKSVSYYTSSGTPQVTLSVDGSLVAGDAGAAYVETQGIDASGNLTNQLWRYPIDGSAPTELATAPTVDGQALDYFGDPLPAANGDGIVKFWFLRDANDQWQLVLGWTPTK